MVRGFDSLGAVANTRSQRAVAQSRTNGSCVDIIGGAPARVPVRAAGALFVWLSALSGTICGALEMRARQTGHQPTDTKLVSCSFPMSRGPAACTVQAPVGVLTVQGGSRSALLQIRTRA